MAWIKIPAEHHPLFRAALPQGATTKNMFGGVAAFVNDNMFGGLFARSIIVKLAPEDQRAALALDGAAPFDPMGNGRIMKDTVLLPDSVMDEPEEMRSWLRRARDYVATLPPKAKATSKAKAPMGAKAATAKRRTTATPGPKATAKQRAGMRSTSRSTSSSTTRPKPKPTPRSKPKPRRPK